MSTRVNTIDDEAAEQRESSHSRLSQTQQPALTKRRNPAAGGKTYKKRQEEEAPTRGYDSHKGHELEEKEPNVYRKPSRSSVRAEEKAYNGESFRAEEYQRQEKRDEDEEVVQEHNLELLEKDIDHLKEEIYSKIDQVLRKDSSKSSRQSPSRSREPKETKEPQGETEEVYKAKRSFHKLKQTLEKKEQLEIEANEALKAKIQRMKHRNRRCLEEIHRLTDMVRSRDEVIANYEENFRASQMELTTSAKKIMTQQIKEDVYSRTKEDLNEVISRLSNKLKVKKHKYQETM